jgi:long-chain fatty acid transport protein
MIKHGIKHGSSRRQHQTSFKRDPARTAGIVALLTVSTYLCTAPPADAQGYGFYQQSPCGTGRAGAGVAAPCDDGSAVFFNPAGLALVRQPVFSVEVTGVAPRGRFTNTATQQVSPLNDTTIAAPAGYVALPVARRVTAAVGVFAPYGLATDWPNTSEGRFLGYYSSLKSIYVQPTIALELTDRVFVGAGVAITHTSLQLRRRLDLSSQAISGTPFTFGALGVPPGTDFADVDITGSGNDVGAHIGVIVKPHEQFSFGARYLFRQQVKVSNGAFAAVQIPTNLTLPVSLPGVPAGTPFDAIVKPAFAAGGPLASQSATTALPLPDQFVAGVAFEPTKTVTLLVDYQWTHWRLFDTTTITYQTAPTTVLVQSYHDSQGVRLAGEYAIGRTIVRVGLNVNGAAAPDQTVTPLLPDAPRNEISAGVRLPLGAKVRLDLAYMFVDQHDRAGRSTDGGLAVPTPAVNNGTFHYYANLLSAGVVVGF